MEFLYEYGLFFMKVVTFVVAIAIVIGLFVNAGGMRQKGSQAPGMVEVNKINDRFDDMRYAIRRAVEGEELIKKEQKQKQKQQKREQKQARRESDANEKRVFLVDFNGDMKASAVANLREIISAILFTATSEDEVVVRLESAGGMVHSYGLAASQLNRIRQKQIPLTVCVDKVAASGGYMMACVANKILAAPFAVIGSIGVVAQLPNFNRLLKKNDIDFEQLTAGEYKRTLTIFGENTDKARKKFIEDLELTHQLFKDFVQNQRSVVNIDDVATGEVWLGTTAKDKNLVDTLSTSDDYLTGLADKHGIYEVTYVIKKSLPEKLGVAVESAVEGGFNRLLEQVNLRRFFH